MALITVLVVMLVGVVIALTVAASVIFTMSANTANKSRTQAFVAAESGRDAALAHLAGTCDAALFPLTSNGDLEYSATIGVISKADVVLYGQPSRSTDSGVATGCPGEETAFVVITSTGTGPNGSQTTVDAVYPWIVTWEQQAGGVLAYFANGVSLRGTYAGDIVVRSGPYTCAADGTLVGDLYVTRGTATFSRDCTVHGDVWSYGDVDASSQRVTVDGNVKAGGVDLTGTTVTANVKFTSNGSMIGTSADPDSGMIEATGTIDLTDTGSTDGHVWGNMIAGGAINVGAKWVVDATATKTPTTAPPAFNPSLEFIRSVTAWMDLDSASGWGSTPINACSLTAAQFRDLLTTGTSAPLVLDYRTCTPSHSAVTFPSGTTTLAKDVAFLIAPAKILDINIKGSIAGDRQMVFVHEDPSRDLVGGETDPTCGNGNQPDTLSIDNGVTIQPRLMVYTPCGLNGTVKSSFRGQLYSNNTSGVTFIGSASYTCALMQWAPAFEKLGCKVRGEGEDAVLETVLTQRLGDRVTQVEQAFSTPSASPTPSATVP
ncbi:hypothetical protein [Microbacterium sp. NPDC056736]|uniref:hypothetical protein n=1 Tax=Microbacterium sp. NPDC056736 TaxID=3345932 RepID=UPI00366F809C